MCFCKKPIIHTHFSISLQIFLFWISSIEQCCSPSDIFTKNINTVQQNKSKTRISSYSNNIDTETCLELQFFTKRNMDITKQFHCMQKIIVISHYPNKYPTEIK